jgi:hypothetical protein
MVSGRLERQQQKGLLTLCRAFLTTKAEALAAPCVLYEDDDYLDGKNVLTRKEKILMVAYE